MCEKNDLDFCVCHADAFLDDISTRTSLPWTINKELLPASSVFSSRDVERDVFKLFIGWNWDKLYGIDFVREKNLRFPEIKKAEYLVFAFLALIYANRIGVVDKVLVHQRRSSAPSLSNRVSDTWHCFYEALCLLRQELQDAGVFALFEQDFINYALHYALWNLNVATGESYEMTIKKLKNGWLKELGIADKEANYFYSKKEYNLLTEYGLMDEASIPLVSIIMPVYNAEKYLDCSISSVLTQTMKEIELICVDDGSTDNSYALLLDYESRDSRVRVFHQNNMFAGVARNKGIKESRAEYVCFLDADDWFEKNAIECLYMNVTDTNSDLCISSFYHADEGSGERIPFEPLGTRRESLFLSSFQESPFYFLSNNNMIPWNKIYKRSMIVDNAITFQDIICANDRAFYINVLLEAKRIAVIPDHLMNYRIGNSTSLVGKTRLTNFNCHFLSFDRIWQLVSACSDEVKKRIIDMTVSDCCHFFRGGNNDDKEKLAGILVDFFSRLELGRLNTFDTYWWHSIYNEALFLAAQKANETKMPIEKPLVSIIIPCYNTEEYIRECLDSVLGQTLENLEIICIDDSSSDKTLDILNEYQNQDLRVKSVCHEVNKGPGAARNTGMRLSTGKYIYFLDSDDCLRPDAMQTLSNYAETFDLDIILFAGEIFTCEGKRVVNEQYFNKVYKNEGNYLGILKGCEALYLLIANKEYTHSPCLYLSNREYINDNPGLWFFESFIHEDISFTMKLVLSAERALIVPDMLFRRRIRSNSIITRNWSIENIEGYINAIEQCAGIIQEENVQREAAHAAVIMIASLFSELCNIIHDLKESIDPDIIEYSRKSYILAAGIIALLEKQAIILESQENYFAERGRADWLVGNKQELERIIETQSARYRELEKSYKKLEKELRAGHIE
jgi:glycosyltransferase involved in cell wall biosynthesis